MRPASIATMLCGVVSCAGPQTLPDLDQSITLAVGPLAPGSEGWDARVTGSVDWSWRKDSWPCAVEFGIQYASAELDDGPDPVDAQVFGMRIGAGSAWLPAEWLRLTAGAGPRLSNAQTWVPGEFAEVRENAVSVGLYAHAGAFVRVTDMISVGSEVQATIGTDYDLAGRERDAQAIGLMLALRWDF